MITIRHSAKDDPKRWRAVLRAFEVEGEAYHPLEAYKPPHGTNVYMVVNGDAERACPLSSFGHPTDANYIFGPDIGDREFEIPPGSIRVTIPARPGRDMFAAQAAAVVLWDRQQKGAA